MESTWSLIKDHYYGDVTTNTEHDCAIFYFFKIVCVYIEAFDMKCILDVSTKGQCCLFIALFSVYLFSYCLLVDLPSNRNVAALIFIVDHADQLYPYVHTDTPTWSTWVLSKEFTSDFFFAKKMCKKLFGYYISCVVDFPGTYSSVLREFEVLVSCLEKSTSSEGDKVAKLVINNFHTTSL